mmetsp:Transcript_11667/g.34963  ORF Transcript_11667/g.34963 Transcript_11667/m.34963 type:complete len:311 (-) Transcript_11667:217-1149(-)
MTSLRRRRGNELELEVGGDGDVVGGLVGIGEGAVCEVEVGFGGGGLDVEDLPRRGPSEEDVVEGVAEGLGLELVEGEVGDFGFLAEGGVGGHEREGAVLAEEEVVEVYVVYRRHRRHGRCREHRIRGVVGLDVEVAGEDERQTGREVLRQLGGRCRVDVHHLFLFQRAEETRHVIRRDGEARRRSDVAKFRHHQHVKAPDAFGPRVERRLISRHRKVLLEPLGERFVERFLFVFFRRRLRQSICDALLCVAHELELAARPRDGDAHVVVELGTVERRTKVVAAAREKHVQRTDPRPRDLLQTNDRVLVRL